MSERWPRKFKTYWVVVDSQGTAYLSTARTRRLKSIAAWIAEVREGDWSYWKRTAKYSCQRCDIKVRGNRP